ncbi:hypothetical protein G7054_g7356 [Neopestalotiopsis clavispora]|nr:hypothetical protein G7054_g7356 [Neopestalotiopsis clavispora]
MSSNSRSSTGASAEFTSFYLQQATKEFAEDLDKVRSADDFKGDALQLLIQALKQGTALLPSADQRRIVDAGKAVQLEDEDHDGQDENSDKGVSSSSSSSSSSNTTGSSDEEE